MRFKEFLLENDAEEFSIDQFAKDCKPFLSDIRGVKESELPVRGEWRTDDWLISSTHEIRRPRHTRVELHDKINDFFEHKFNWRAREKNSLFISSDKNVATLYGYEYAVFPIGQYQSLWSPDIIDVYSRTFDYKDEDALKQIENAKWIHNGNLLQALVTVHEIILGCKKYYAFKLDSELFRETVLPFLKSAGIVK